VDAHRDLPHRQTDRLETDELPGRRRARARDTRARLVLGAIEVAVSTALVVSGCTSVPSEAGPTKSLSVTPAPSASTVPTTPGAAPTKTTTHVDIDLSRSKQRWMIRSIRTDY